MTPAQAAELIADDATVVCAGFVGAGHAEAVSRALEARFLARGSPRNLTLVYAAGQGDRLQRGVNHFGHAGLVRRIIGGHWISAPRLGALVNANAVEAWNLPQGVIAQMFRAIAGGKPGVITPIGLHTFVDPRHDGGRLTPCTAASALEPRVELINLRGRELLFYPGLKVDVALIRATTADERGNLSTEEEPFHQDLLAIAQAAHNSGGIVIAQVKRIVPALSIDPNRVRVPGILVDHLVIADDPADHWMTFGEPFNPAYTGAGPRLDAVEAPTPLGLRKIIQRRAFLELLQMPRFGGQPGRRHAGGHRAYRPGRGPRRLHGDGGIGPGGRHAGAVSQFRRQRVSRGHHRSGVDVRLLRWRRARHRLSRFGRVRRPGQRERQPLRYTRGGCRRLHQHHAKRSAGGVHGHAHRGRPAGPGRRRSLAHRARRRSCTSWSRACSI